MLIRPQSGPDSSGDSVQLDKLYARITWHVMPLFLVVMVLNHVDRTNLAYACECSRAAAVGMWVLAPCFCAAGSSGPATNSLIMHAA